jgi:cobalt-zinc-cadmium efflux system outer membrane protein
MKYRNRASLSALWIGLIGLGSPAAWSQQIPESAGQISRPMIASFVNEVLTEHPAIAAAQAELDAAMARAQGASRSIYNPELEVEFEDADSTSKAVGLSQTLDWSGKRKAQTATAKSEVFAAKAARELVQKTIATDLLAALADHQSAFALLRLADAKVRLARDFLGLASTRELAGDLSQSELLTARLALSQAEAERASISLGLSRAREHLSSLSGQQKQVWPLLVGLPETALLLGSDIELGTLPEIRLSSATADGFRSRILLADKMRKADPTIGLRFGEESDGRGGQTTLFGVRLSIPLQIRNNFSQSVDVARAEALGADANTRNTRRLVAAKLQSTTERVAASQKAWEQWQSGGASQLSEQRELLKTLWEAGETDAVSYLLQLNQTFDAQAASIELKSALWTSWFEWLDASNSSQNWLEKLQ